MALAPCIVPDIALAMLSVALAVMSVSLAIVFAMLPVVLVVMSVTTAIVLTMLPVVLVVMSVTTAIVLTMLPAALVAIPVTPAMVSVVLRAVYFVRAEIAVPGGVVVESPPRGLSRAVVILKQVVNKTARDNRVGLISLGGGNAARYQACGEQEGLKQCAGFHESDSFFVGLMKQ